MILEFIVTIKDKDTMLKHVLKNRLNLSRTFIRRLKANNMIFVNGEVSYVSTILKVNDVVKVNLIEHKTQKDIIKTKMDLDILYEDEYIIGVNKPAGILVHPVSKDFEKTLLNGLAYLYPDIVTRPIGRLDRNTTGVVLFAKNAHVHAIMAETLKEPTSKKKYYAINHGLFKSKEGSIDTPIKRSPDSIITRITAIDGKPSKTIYKILKEFNNASIVEFQLLTGRTHQIRVHSKSINHPIIGDDLYGEKSNLIARQALHSLETSFIHPFTTKYITISAPIPDDMVNLMNKL